jgi:Reverse transcriptase (RNA-dependent DNA polymerase)
LYDFDPDDGPAPELHGDYRQNVTEPIVPEVPTEPPDLGNIGMKATPQTEGQEHILHSTQPDTTNDFVEPLQPSKNEESVVNVQAPMNEPNPPVTQDQSTPSSLTTQRLSNQRERVSSQPYQTQKLQTYDALAGLVKEDSPPDASTKKTNVALEFLLEAHAAAVNDPDTLSWNEAMRAPDAEMFKDSAYAEIKALQQAGTWTLVDKSKVTSKILPGIWVFRRKRNQGTGEIYKYKGRYSVRGDLQEGTFDTFAPVVQWSTVRMLIMIALRYGYKTKCIDFSNAFVQAKLSTPVWIHLPRGNYQDIFGEDTEGKCLELKKSLYGLSVAPKLWYLHLREQLEAKGFKPSAIDPCYISETVWPLQCMWMM